MLLLLLSSDTVEITPSWIKKGPLWWRTWSIPMATQQAAVQVMESRPEVFEASFVQQTRETVLGLRVPYTMSKTEAGMLAGNFIMLVREYTDKKAYLASGAAPHPRIIEDSRQCVQADGRCRQQLPTSKPAGPILSGGSRQYEQGRERRENVDSHVP